MHPRSHLSAPTVPPLFERTFSECKRKWILHICPFSFYCSFYSCLLSLYCFTVLYCLLLFCNNFTVLYCLCQDVLFLLPHADIHHINRIHKKHDNTFCAVDFSGCPCKSPYNHTHDDQDDNINDILHEECDRADRTRTPRISKILKMLEPITLPSAISTSSFLAPTIEVTNS